MKPYRTIIPIDYANIAEKLKMHGKCTLTEYPGGPPVRIERFATCSSEPLTIALTGLTGPYSDSQPRPILTLTHRASGLALDLPDRRLWWFATAAGLREAKRILKAIRVATTDVDWKIAEPITNPTRIDDVQKKIAKCL